MTRPAAPDVYGLLTRCAGHNGKLAWSVVSWEQILGRRDGWWRVVVFGNTARMVRAAAMQKQEKTLHQKALESTTVFNDKCLLCGCRASI
jgi:hypothetical protein